METSTQRTHLLKICVVRPRAVVPSLLRCFIRRDARRPLALCSTLTVAPLHNSYTTAIEPLHNQLQRRQCGKATVVTVLNWNVSRKNLVKVLYLRLRVGGISYDIFFPPKGWVTKALHLSAAQSSTTTKKIAPNSKIF